VKIKRLLLTCAAMLAFGLASFAEVSVKNIDGTNVEITFTFKDDTASQMNVIGSFDGWTVPGEPMARNAAGLWEFKLKAKVTDEIQYKFYNNGAWIFDFKAPDKKDDGFGGNNGLIVVADVLASAGGKSGGAALVLPARKKVGFGTLTWVESDTNFDTAGGAFAALNSKVDAYSLWKFSGDFAPGMPGNIEFTMFDGTSPVWGGTLAASDGLQSLASGLVFNPGYFLGNGSRPAFNKLEFGFETGYVSYSSGYLNAWFPGHSSILWDTLAYETNLSGSGYSSFATGPRLQKLGDFSIDAAIMPNKSLDNFFGLVSYVNLGQDAWKLELQYDLRSGTRTDPLKMFEAIPRQDLILGGQGFLGQLSMKGQFLLSAFAAGGAVDSRPIQDKVAAEVSLGYTDLFDIYSATLDLRYRGYAAQMLYASNDDVLGPSDTLSIGGKGSYRIGHWVTARMDAALELPASSASTGAMTVYLTPGTGLDFSVPAQRPLTADLYGKVALSPTASPGFVFTAAAVKVSVGKIAPGLIEGLDLYYGVDNTDSTVLFNSLLAEAKFGTGLTGQLGLGLRSGSSAASTYAACLGASWALPLPAAKSPSLYAQALYNMDPYDASARNSFDFNDEYTYLPAGGYAKSDGLSALRLGITWDF